MDPIELRLAWAEGDKKRDANKKHPRSVITNKNIAYGPHGKENRLDLHMPKVGAYPMPVIIACHGGGYFYGDKELYGYYCEDLAKRGFAVINFNYRLAPESKFPAPLEDANEVVRWLLENGYDYGLDTHNIFILGDSAGAHLAAQLALCYYNPKVRERFPSIDWVKVELNAIALNCGFYDLKNTGTGVIEEWYLTPSVIKEYGDVLDFAKLIPSNFPPTYVASCSHDFLLPCAAPFANALKKAGIATKLKIYSAENQKIQHVKHIDVGDPIADQWNDDEMAFFVDHIKENEEDYE